MISIRVHSSQQGGVQYFAAWILDLRVQALRRAADNPLGLADDSLLPAGTKSLMELHQEIVSKHLKTEKMHEEITSLLAGADAATQVPRNACESSNGLFKPLSHVVLPCSLHWVAEQCAPVTWG